MAFLAVIPIAMLIAVLFDKKIEETIALSMIWSALFTYICGLIYELWIAAYIIAGISALSFVGALVLIVKRKSYKNVVTFGLAQYGLLCGYYLLVFKGRFVTAQDSLRVYEKFTREFYYVGDICRYRNAVGLMAWKYLSLRFWPNYSESIQLFAGVTLCAAMLVFIFREIACKENRRPYVRAFLSLFFMLFLPLTFRNGILSMQFDFVSGILTAYVLYAYIALKRTEDSFYKVMIISGLAYLVHIKTTGIILALICSAVMVGMEMTFGEKKGLLRYRFSITCAIVSIVSKMTWSLFCRINDGEEKFSLLHAMQTINPLAVGAALVMAAVALFIGVRILLSRNFKAYIAVLMLMAAAIFAGTTVLIPSGSRVMTMTSFARIIFSNYCVDREYGFGTNFLAPFIIVIVALPCLLYIVAYNTEGGTNNENKTFMILVNAGFALYASVVYLTNFYGRGLGQTVKAKECERYLFLYIIVFMLLYLTTIMNDYNRSPLYAVVIGMMLFTTVFCTKPSMLYTQVVNRPEVETFDVMGNIDISFPDVLYFVDEKKEQSIDRFHFIVSPGRAVETDYSDMYLNDVDEPHKITHEEWVEKLKECRYVYLATTGEDFAGEYGDVFDDEIVDGHIYSVIMDGESVRLKVVEVN